MKWLIFVLLTFFTDNLISFDRFLDINLTTDFSNLKQRSHIDFNSQAVVPFSKQAFLLNPRISLFFDGSMDVSLATGLRHQLNGGTLGHHLFWNSTATRDAHFHQIGHSLEFLSETFDYRINYYHPITKDQVYKNYLVSPHRWIETEIVYKHPAFQIGAGPKYDLFQKAFGIQAKVTIPFQFFSVGTLISYDKINKFSGAISVSFRLYGTPRNKLTESPIQYQSRVQYSKELIFIPPPPEPKKRENQKQLATKPKVEEQKVEIAIEDPPIISEETIVAAPVEHPPVMNDPPKSKSWWDFFFHPRHHVDPIL